MKETGIPQRTAPLSELAAEALVGLRLANNYRGSPMSEEEARTLTALALAAAADAAQRGVVSAYVAKLQFPAAASGRALMLYEKLLTAAPEPQLWASAVAHWMAADDQADVPTVSRLSSSASFLVATLEQLMAGADTAPLNWLRQLTAAQQDIICSFLAAEAPAALGLELADRGWAAADAELQHRLAKLVVELIEVNLGDDAQLIAQVRTVGDFLPTLRHLIPSGMGGMSTAMIEQTLRGLPPQLPVPDFLLGELRQLLRDRDRRSGALYNQPQQAAIQRFAPRLVAVSQPFVELAMQATRSDAEASQLAKLYIAALPRLEAALPFLYRVYLTDRPPVLKAVLDHILTRWQDDAPALARLLLRLQQQGAPRKILVPFARTLLLADPDFAGVRDADYQAALSSARQLLPARERRMLGIAPVPAAKPRKPRAPAARDPKSGRSHNQPLSPPAAAPRPFSGKFELPEAPR